ncbi:unnamed protein product [Arctia plantaginis]|uniref:Uncharacterized protein n=1 Tax=Arctia plantaginis TaxID=874455 RepID=A0A8S0YV74_ARCPL|nr:unnamed protein product [Arctia plantaginis]
MCLKLFQQQYKGSTRFLVTATATRDCDCVARPWSPVTGRPLAFLLQCDMYENFAVTRKTAIQQLLGDEDDDDSLINILVILDEEPSALRCWKFL